MNETESNAATSGPLTVPARSMVIARWTLAVLLTFGMLVAATRLTIVWMAHSAREPRLLVLLLAALLFTPLLTWNLGADCGPACRRWTRPVVLGVWMMLVGLGVFAYSAPASSHRWVVPPLFAFGLAWAPWLGWIGFTPAPLIRRLVEGLVLAGGALLLVSAVTVEAMRGDNTIDFTWSWSPPRDLQMSFPEPVRPDVIAIGLEPTAHDFPQFLGPARTAVIESGERPTDWNERPPRELWRKPVGPGWSGFAVRGEYAFTHEQRGEEEAVTCYRLKDGELVWMTKSPGRFASAMGGIGPRATPALADDGRLYTVGATGVLQCLDAVSGRPEWAINIVSDVAGSDHNHGVCGSPLIVNEQVIVAPTGNAEAALVSYNRITGKLRWRAGRSMASYSSPAFVTLAGRPQVLLHTQQVLESHDPQTGDLLWEFPWTNANVNNCSQPVIVDADRGRLVVSTGYGVGAALVEVAPAEPAWKVSTIWTSRDMKTKFTTAVRFGEHLYGLDDGILACIKLSDGKRRWKTGRYNHGQILLVGSTLLVQAEMGDLALVAPRPEKWDELARIPMLNNKTWNNPTVSGSYLLVRNGEEAVCLEWPERAAPLAPRVSESRGEPE